MTSRSKSHTRVSGATLSEMLHNNTPNVNTARAKEDSAILNRLQKTMRVQTAVTERAATVAKRASTETGSRVAKKAEHTLKRESMMSASALDKISNYLSPSKRSRTNTFRAELDNSLATAASKATSIIGSPVKALKEKPSPGISPLQALKESIMGRDGLDWRSPTKKVSSPAKASSGVTKKQLTRVHYRSCTDVETQPFWKGLTSRLAGSW